MTMIIKRSNKSIQNSINDTLLDLNEDITITNSAYTQARAKLNYTAFEEFAYMARDIFYQDDFETYLGFRILAIDGSIITLPNTDDIKVEFNPMNVGCQIEDFTKEVVQARISCMYDVLNNVAIEAIIANKNKSEYNNLKAYDERTLAFQHLQQANHNDLVILDRGYPSYELFAKAYENKTNIVCRIRKNSFAKAKFLFAPHCEKKDVILEINAPKSLKEELKIKNIPTKLKIRFIQVKLDNNTIEVLATNVTNSDILKTSDFKKLYSLRWGIETYFDLIKNRLSLENFTGLTALSVKQDFYATIFLTNYESALTYDLNQELKENSKDNKYEQKINKAVSFNIIKHKIFDLLYKDDIDLDELLQKVEKLFITNTIIIRPNRKSNPRLDKNRQKSTIATNTINHLKRKKKVVGN